MHWPALLVAGVCLYPQYLPSIDLAEPGDPAPEVVTERGRGRGPFQAVKAG